LARVEEVDSSDYEPLKGITHLRRLFALALPEVPCFLQPCLLWFLLC
jgi:hypothetical protein